MSAGSNSAVTSFVAAVAGVALTLLLSTWLLSSDDPELLAAEQRFGSLTRTDAQRILATYDRLHEPSRQQERQRIETIHHAVTSDQQLDDKLQQLYAWWKTLDDAQRQELRELPSEAWRDEMQSQIAASEQESIPLQLPWPLSRRRGLRVSRQQVERFLTDALPTAGLRQDDTQLIESVDAADRALAQVLVIAAELAPRRSGSSGADSDAAARTFTAAQTHLLSDWIPGDRMDPRGQAMVSFAVLRSLKDHLSADFLRRHDFSDEKIEQTFSSLDTPERIRQMMSDPTTAVRSMQAQLRSADRETPTGRLAARLTEFNRVLARLGDRFRQRGQRDRRFGRGGPGSGRRPDADRRDRGPRPDSERGRPPDPPPDRGRP